MKKILIIEDEKLLAEMYEDKFTRVGFKVHLALDAKEGWELTKKENPDLILLDILLPEENGIMFLKWLSKNQELAKIPVIIFSNYENPTIKKEAIKLGAKEYLIKTNYTPQEIIEKINFYLKENREAF